MAEFKISRFRYTWEGNWATAVTYNRDDVVYYSGSAWVCIRQHNSSTFNADITYIPSGETLATPAWVKMSEGRAFRGPWITNTLYQPNEFVEHGGNLYLCTVSHTSATYFNTNINNWEVFATGQDFLNAWIPATRYLVGDVVRYNGYTYQCTLEHVAGSLGIDFSEYDGNDSTSDTWQTVVENYSYAGEYNNNTIYRKNDLVKYGGSILKCVVEHTSTNSITNSYFITYLSGFEYDGGWTSTTEYAIGDVVRYGGVIYVANINNLGNQPGVNEIFEDSVVNANWTVVSKGINFRGEYDPGSATQYQEGDVVRRGGALWVSLTNQFGDDSSLIPLDTTLWQLVLAAQNFRGSWRTDQDYNFYDAVYFRGTVYYASVPHNSSFTNFPGDNGEGIDYWTVLLIGDPNAALNILGDLLTFNLKRNVIKDGSTQVTIGDESTIGTTPIAIGTKDQLLTVEDNVGSIGYAVWGTVERIFFVRTDGIDDTTDPDRGVNFLKPFKTLRFALEQADDEYSGFTSIKISTGEYQEVLPLIVPKRTAIIGEELRSVSIRANDPIVSAVADNTYFSLALIRLGVLLPNIITSTEVIPSVGNSIPQIRLTGGGAVIIPASPEAQLVDTLWGSILDTKNFKITGTGSLPIITGSNTPATQSVITLTIQLLEDHREFLVQEALSYTNVFFHNQIINETTWSFNLNKFISALQYDLRYPGNYTSVRAGRY
jgi:chitodextrinase